nr:DUF429 domain-containing protein [Propionibacterium sp.]
MFFVGIDLAWGERAASGLAVLDEAGALVHLARATTDEAIVAELADYVAGDCVVGIDAPLVVTNPTGNRPCEAALNHDFARFDAGTHPANTGKPEFGGGARGARLAARLGLDLDPAAARRRALEVYPHAALVALFRLGRTLKYKQRPNRPFPLVQGETLRLVGLLEGLADAAPPLLLTRSAEWAALVAQVAAATRKSELRRVEDPLDAVVCAYVALLAERRPATLTTYGDAATGAIVTPTLPDGLLPSPRPRAVPALASPAESPPLGGGPDAVAAGTATAAPAASGTGPEPTPTPAAPAASGEPTPQEAAVVREAVRRYALLQPRVADLARRLAAWLTTVLDDAGINYLDVAWRGKGVASFAAKSGKRPGGVPLYPDPLADITDQIGVRVITYVTSDVAAVAGLVADQLTVVDDKDLGQATAHSGRFGYVSRHLQVALDGAWVGDADLAGLRVPSAQIQLRTVLQHAWAEFEHDIRYKGSIPEAIAPDLDRRFTLAAGLLELADREFETIRNRLREGMAGRTPASGAAELRIGDQELAAFLAGRFPDAGWSRTDHYTWMAGLLAELGMTSLRELAGALPAGDSTIAERMNYRYPPGAVRRLDDALLFVFGERYLGLAGNAHRVALLRNRLDKLRSDGVATQPTPEP